MRAIALSATACALAAIAAGLGCTGDDAGAGGAAASPLPTSSTTVGTTTSGGGLPVPPDAPPDGWHRWPFPPEDCNVYVPDDLATVEVPPWEPCPYMPDGCVRMDSPWRSELGLGYGGAMTVAQVGRITYAQLLRRAPGGWDEGWLFRDDALVGAWRGYISADTSFCGVRGPYAMPDGSVTLGLVRKHAEHAPFLAWGAPETLTQQPDAAQVVDAGPTAFPTGGTTRSNDLLVLEEHYEHFTVYDLRDGTVHRPESPTGGSIGSPFAVGGTVFFHVWELERSSVWAWTRESGSVPILRDDQYSYNVFDTDGEHAAWERGHHRTGVNQYETVEVFAAPIDEDAVSLEAKWLMTMPHGSITHLSVGDGWVGVGVLSNDVRLLRVDGTEERRLPFIEGLGFHSGPRALAIAGRHVWTRTPYSNNVQHIVRFEMEKLAAFPPPEKKR
jgi:hypothetical protein